MAVVDSCLFPVDEACAFPPRDLSQFPSGLYQPKNPFRDVYVAYASLYYEAPNDEDQSDAHEPTQRWDGLTAGSRDQCESPRSLVSSPRRNQEANYLLQSVSIGKSCRGGTNGEVESEEEGSKVNEDVDSSNVKAQALNDLFSSIENDSSGNGIDFSVLLEGEHAFNVEEVSEMFSDLEATPDVLAADAVDAQAVDDVTELFAALEKCRNETECSREVDLRDVIGDAVDDLKDAENVGLLSDLFSELEETELRVLDAVTEQSDPSTNSDWIASLDVDNVSDLFTELEKEASVREDVEEVKPVKRIDARVFVPKFTVRIEGRAGPVQVPIPRVPALVPPGTFLAGPLGLVGNTKLRHLRRVEADWSNEKRKASPDPYITETRRACAAKRRRVNGRFVREPSGFVSITSLQPSK